MQCDRGRAHAEMPDNPARWRGSSSSNPPIPSPCLPIGPRNLGRKWNRKWGGKKRMTKLAPWKFDRKSIAIARWHGKKKERQKQKKDAEIRSLPQWMMPED